MKYPVVYVFKNEGSSLELRYSLRSLKNLTNFNGKVFLVGDKESWFKDIVHVPFNKVIKNRYEDAEYKLMSIMTSPVCPDKFIYMNDDIYITTPREVTYLHQGEIAASKPGIHNMQKLKTLDWLLDKDLPTLDYDIHTPMLFDREKRLKISAIMKRNSYFMKPRTLYGNIYYVGGEYYKDQKTRTLKLPKADIISTKVFTPDLKVLFPEKSDYEK